MKFAWIIIKIHQCVRQIISEDLLPQIAQMNAILKVEPLAPDGIDFLLMLDNTAIGPKISWDLHA